MTFEQWWQENKPRTPGELRQKRLAMLAWNAALQTVCNQKFTREEFPIAFRLPAEILDQIMRLGA
jgi:hypothetical protein